MARPWMIVASCFVVGCAVAASPSPHQGDSEARVALNDSRPEPAREPVAVLTLQDAAALALLGNPELAEYSWQLRASEARAPQAGARPNPEASVYVEDVLGTGEFHGARRAQVTLQLSQAIELGGKRAARIATATESRNVASREYETKRLDVVAAVTRRFIDVLAAQEVVVLAKVNLTLSQATLDETVRRVQAGAGSALGERKARIELSWRCRKCAATRHWPRGQPTVG